MGSQETVDTRNKKVIPAFCCLKAGRHIGIEQHLQGRKEGGERLQKVRWLDQDCNKCGRQLNVGRRIEGDANSELFFQPLSH